MKTGVGIAGIACALQLAHLRAEDAGPVKVAEAGKPVTALTPQQLETLNRLVAEMKSTDHESFMKAFNALVAMGEPAVDPLYKYFKEATDYTLRARIRNVIHTIHPVSCEECGRG